MATILNLRSLVLVFMAAASCLSAQSQEAFRPERAVRIVVPYGAGGSVDAQARLLAERLRVSFEQPVLVENRAGASGMIGASEVVRAKPDGYTLLLTNTAIVQAPLTSAAAKFNPLKDLVPIAQVSLPQVVFVIDASLPYKTLQEFTQAARTAKPGFTYGSAGYGQSLHLFGVMLAKATGTDLTHIPYTGEAQIVNGMLGHQVQSGFLTTNAAAPHIKAGTLRPLAMLSSTRWTKLPNLPTFAQAGVPGMDLVTFVGVFGPKELPATVTGSLNRQINAALKSGEIEQKFDTLDINPGQALSEREFANFLNGQYALWKDIVDREGIRVDDTRQ